MEKRKFSYFIHDNGRHSCAQTHVQTIQQKLDFRIIKGSSDKHHRGIFGSLMLNRNTVKGLHTSRTWNITFSGGRSFHSKVYF